MRAIALLLALMLAGTAHAAEPAAILIKPAAVWTGLEDKPHPGWAVLVGLCARMATVATRHERGRRVHTVLRA